MPNLSSPATSMTKGDPPMFVSKFVNATRYCMSIPQSKMIATADFDWPTVVVA